MYIFVAKNMDCFNLKMIIIYNEKYKGFNLNLFKNKLTNSEYVSFYTTYEFIKIKEQYDAHIILQIINTDNIKFKKYHINQFSIKQKLVDLVKNCDRYYKIKTLLC